MIRGATMNFSQKEQSKGRPFEKDKVLLLYPLNLEGVPKISRLTNCRFTNISSQISAIYMNIFHKTDVQTVILRC